MLGNIFNFFSNVGLYLGNVIIEGVMIFVFSYITLQGVMTFFISGKDDDKFSNCINKIIISSGLYYILRFSEVYLLNHFK